MAHSTLFIPDISGFTRFVKSTEITHSKHIIEELINLIIEIGSKSFELVEVEGDAVFFYKEEEMDADQVTRVAKKIFLAFHEHLMSYEYDRICNCGACSQAIDLTLKFVAHSGEITLANYGVGRSKPFGDAVIAAHRLLKNEVPLDQYVLMTDQFLGESALQFDGDGFNKDESLGHISFKYLDINHWKSEVVVHKKDLVSKAVDAEVRVSDAIPLASEVLHQFISDFRYRHLWNHEATEIIYKEDEINQTGSEHFCVINGKNFEFSTIKPDFDKGLSYGEILKDPGPLKYMELNFLLIPESLTSTHLTVQIRAKLKWKLQQLMLPLLRARLHSQVQKVLDEIKGAVEIHAAQLNDEFGSSTATKEPVVA